MEWETVLLKSITSMLDEVGPYTNICKYIPESSSDMQIYNDNLIAFKRIYNDTYRFLVRYVKMGSLTYILTLCPRHIYWNLNPGHLNDILYYIENNMELALLKYMHSCLKHNAFHDKYIQVLGYRKLEFIDSKYSIDLSEEK